MFLTLAIVISAPPATTYADVRAYVEAGMPLVVYAGVPMPVKAEPNAVRVDAIPGEPAGVYDCRRVDGRPTMTARVAKPVAVRTVPGHEHKCRSCGTIWAHADGDTNASHSCPTCGRQQLDKLRSVPVEVKPTAAKPKRLSIGGRWYDEYPDGRRVECVT